GAGGGNGGDGRHRSYGERMRQRSLADALRVAETSRYGGLLGGWGKYASEGDLRVILDRLLGGGPPALLANYLRVFFHPPFPQFDQRLLGLLDHEEEVRRRAFTAVAQNAHPSIRRFALDHVEEWRNEPNFVELFVRNFQPGDEALLMRHLRIPDDLDACHWILRDVKKVLEENPTASCEELGL